MFKLVFFHFAFENKIHTKALINEFAFVEDVIKWSRKIELTSGNLRAGGIVALLSLSLKLFSTLCGEFCTLMYYFVFFCLLNAKSLSWCPSDHKNEQKLGWVGILSSVSWRDCIPLSWKLGNNKLDKDISTTWGTQLTATFSATMKWRESVKSPWCRANCGGKRNSLM